MLADGPHLGADRAGDREPLGVERLKEPSDRLGEVLALPPRLPSLHPGQVQERNPHVVLRVEVRDRDGEEIGPGRRSGRRRARGRPPTRDRLLRVGSVAASTFLRMFAIFTCVGPGCRPVVTVVPQAMIGNLQPALGELLREVKRAEREMAADHHHLSGLDMRRGGVEHDAVAVRRQRDEDRIGAVDRLGAARRHPRAELSLERARGDQRLARRRARACVRPEGDHRMGSCPRSVR